MTVRGNPSRDAVGTSRRKALAGLFKDDAYLLQVGAKEGSITNHFARHLGEEFPEWHVDVEYNRDLVDVKRLPIPPREPGASDIEAVTVYPDIIVHRRGTDDNLLVVEVKKTQAGKHDFDRQKLRYFTSPPPDGFGYRFGVLVNLPPVALSEQRLEWIEEEMR